MSGSGMMSRLRPGTVSRTTFFVTLGGASVFAVYETWRGGERWTREALLPAAHALLPAETCHRAAVWAAAKGLGFGRRKLSEEQEARLRTSVWGTEFATPIGLAAGFDKDAEALASLRRRSGFSLVEVGTVTPLPQPGNPKPRVFLLPEHHALINRYGFNSQGHGPVAQRLREDWEARRAEPSQPSRTVWTGVNLGKNKEAEQPHLDFSVGVALLGPYADYVTINVSSPNTPGLRALQGKAELRRILQEVHGARRRIVSRERDPPKVLLKIAPDLSDAELSDIAQLATDGSVGVDGVIVSNTTVARDAVQSSPHASEAGGLSGPPLREKSRAMVGKLYGLTGGRLVIVGSGGVGSGEDAYRMLRAGASLVQLYTAMVYQGFPVVQRVQRELAQCLERDGFASANDAVGADHKSAAGKLASSKGWFW